MKALNIILLVSICIQLLSCDEGSKLVQPKINSQPKMYTYFGETIEDSYSNLEDLDDSLVLDWIKDQTSYTNKIINNISGRHKFFELKKQSDVEIKTSIALLKVTPNDKYFYIKKKATDSIYSLYYRNGLSGKEKILLNPSKIKERAIINYIQPNYDGSNVVVNLTENGAEIGDIYTIDVANNVILKDVLENCWPSELAGVTWLTNNSFIYSYIPVINPNSEDFILNTSSVLYNLGDNPKKRNVLLSNKHNPNLNIIPADFPIVSIKDQNEKYIFGRIGGARYFDDYYYALGSFKSKIEWKSLYKKDDKVVDFVVDRHNNLFFITAKNASNYKIAKTNLANPNFIEYKTLVKESSESVITDMVITNDGLFFVKTKNGVEAKLFQLKNKKIIEIPIPKPSGSIKLFSNGSKYKQLWIEIEGWTNNLERYKYNFENKDFTSGELYPASVLNNLKDFIVKEIEVSSHDGVMVPLSIIHKKDMKLNSKNPLFITGYGAFGTSDTPYMDDYMCHWVNNGGVYAIAHVRGGGEKGDKWHKGGYKSTKPNSWKDFIACTKYLINENYTNPKQVAAWSASAGGILIGRAITDRPDLYAVAVIKVGALNMLRNEFATNGQNGIVEFGSVKDSLGFKALYEMDAYHHIKKDEYYPAVFLTGGVNDSRVPAWQAIKFAAKMQESTISSKQILLSIDLEGGHGFDISENKQNKELADVLTFALWQTGHPEFQMK